MLYMSQFLPVSVRNWGSADEATGADAKGQIVNLHGIDDVVASYSQAIVADSTYTVMAGVTANAAATSDESKLPGLEFATYAFSRVR